MTEYIEAVKRELLFHKANILKSDFNVESNSQNQTQNLPQFRNQNIKSNVQNEALTSQGELKNQEFNTKNYCQNQTENYENSFKKGDVHFKSLPTKEPQQMNFLKSQNIVTQNKTNKMQANLLSQPNRTLIIRNGVKHKNSFDRAIITSNNLKLSSQMLGDEFQKRSELLNKKLETVLQSKQNQKEHNKSNHIIQTIKKSNDIIKTIYIGGGTPSILPVNAIPELLIFIKQNFTLDDNCEITVEANPDSFTLTKAIAWRSEGVNRISFGLQSDDDKVLKEIGRVHNFAQFLTAVDNAKKAGFTNINADILLGLPNQTVENAVQTVNNIAKLGLTHISAYGLIVEEGTPFAEQVKSGEVALPSEEQAVAIYNAVVEELKKLGFARYEISNFAKIDNGGKGDFEKLSNTSIETGTKSNIDEHSLDGKNITNNICRFEKSRDIFCVSNEASEKCKTFQYLKNKTYNDKNLKNNATSKNFEMKQYQKQLKSKQDYTKFQCLHNLNYWARGEFLGVGLSAYSFMNGEHWENTRNLNEYLNQPYIRQNIEPETKETAMKETIMLALRCENGLDIVKFNQTFDADFERIYEKQIKKLLENNLIKIENQHLKILDFEVSNSIISDFF